MPSSFDVEPVYHWLSERVTAMHNLCGLSLLLTSIVGDSANRRWSLCAQIGTISLDLSPVRWTAQRLYADVVPGHESHRTVPAK